MTRTNLRPIKARDTRVLAAVLGRHLPGIANITGDKDSDEYKREVGMRLVGIILDEELEALWGWIADINQMTPQELDDGEPDLPLAILTDLYKGDQLKGFLEQLQSLVPRKETTESLSTV
ncbi:hypothetical protein [Roseinatronobacter alkalisoli]|uniref:Uncharacterized protein n=1 Tax=Roseinatronobacter alkalisoli TaxID=3028235 RepID=A0ABT5TER8_9RHOB|nr:hypothetical protein [Roseinatronobacter sp. HJB301]MDD7973444.1 hypothetical protein [Roseinatronobacter sp. HJB301]